MQKSSIILALAGVVVLAGVVFLFFAVRGGSGESVSEDKRARALAEYERRKAANERVPVRPAAADKRRRLEPPPRPATNEREEVVRDPSDESRRPNVARLPRHSPLSKPNLAPTRAAKDESEEGSETKKQMAAATRLFDKGNYPAAQEKALEVLEDAPRNIKMLRVVVTTMCSTGEVEGANEYLRRLPARHQSDMRRRCSKWGVKLEGSK